MDFHKTTPKNIRYNLQNLNHLVFEVTDRCNLNCKYCGYSDFYRGYDTREGKNLSFKRAKLIIDYLSDLWKDDISDGRNNELVISFYGGEPLMNFPFIKQVIDYAEMLGNVGRCCSYGITTNAVLMDQYMDFLVEKNFRLLISLDGNKFAQSYRVDHSGKSSFDRVFRNINLLRVKYPDYFKKSVSFNSVLHNRNEVESIYQFICTHFDKVPRISPLYDVGICEKKKEEFIKMYRNHAESFHKSSNCEAIESEMLMRAPRTARLANYILYQSGNSFLNYNELFISQEDLPFSTGTCSPFSKKMFVTVNGKILPCERISQQFSLGQVHEDRIELNEEYVANKHNFYVSKYAKQCANCASNQFCMQCVYHIDDICKDETHCPNYLSGKDLENRNEKVFEFLQEKPEYYRRILEEVKIEN